MVHKIDIVSRIRIILPNKEHITLPYGTSSIVEDLFHEVCALLNVEDRELFGLAVLSNPGERLSKINFKYLTSTSNITKLCSHSWWTLLGSFFTEDQNSDEPNLSGLSYEEPVVYFRLRFYVPVHCLRDRSTQHAYYCQLRNNVIQYDLFCSVDVYLDLAAFGLQADMGNAPMIHVKTLENSKEMLPIYFNLTAYFPAKLLAEIELPELVRWTLSRHYSLRNMVQFVAEFWYIRLASKRGSNFNMHLYSLPRLRQPRFTVFLGITPDGLLIHQKGEDEWIRPTVMIRWREVDHFIYKRRSVLVVLKGREGLRRLPLRYALSARHLFALISHMHYYQATAELSAPHSAELVKQIERGQYEERRL